MSAIMAVIFSSSAWFAGILDLTFGQSVSEAIAAPPKNPRARNKNGSFFKKFRKLDI
jgi:hypothetical protein